MNNGRLLFAAATVVAALAVSSCSSGAASSKPSGVPTSAAASAVTPSQTASSTAKSCSCVVVLAELPRDNSYELRFIDPATRAVVGVRPFSYDTNVHTLFGGGGVMTGAQMRSAFNADFTQVAATKSGRADNDMVGSIWLNGQKPVFSAGIAEASSSGFGVRVQRGIPVYGSDGREYYVEQQGDDNAFKSVGRDGQPKEVSEYHRFAEVTTAAKPIYFFPNDAEPHNYFPDRAAFSLKDDYGFRVSSNGGAIEYGNLAAGQVNSVTLPKGAYHIPLQAGPLVYLDHTSYVSIENKTSEAGTLSKVVNKTVVSGGRITNTPLTPPTDGDVLDPTASPDGAKVVLALVKGGKTSLVVVDAEGAKSLVTLYDFSGDAVPAKSYRVLGWQKVTLK